jgi:hypothetical protein
VYDSQSGPCDRLGTAGRDRAEQEAIPRCAALDELGRALSGKSRERRYTQEREDPRRKPVIAPVFVPGGLGGFHEENHYL